jgi:hypothetical protein
VSATRDFSLYFVVFACIAIAADLATLVFASRTNCAYYPPDP